MGPGAVNPAATPAWKTELLRLGPYLVGVGVLYPVAELLAVRSLGEASRSAVDASGLVTAWLVTIFLLVLVGPLFLNRTAHNNLRTRAMVEGGGRVLGLVIVSLLLSFVLAPGGETDVVLNVVNFHIFLLTFCLVLASVFYLTQGLGLSGTGGQIAATAVGLAMVGTVLYFNPLIEGEAVGEGLRHVSTDLCIGANPVIVSFHNFLGVDFFHIESVYKFSALSGYPYKYPSWEGVAGAYTLVAVGFFLATTLAYYLRVVLPDNLLARRIQENRELKSSKISTLRETGESAFTFAAPETPLAPPGEEQAFEPDKRSGPTILESLFEQPAEDAPAAEEAPAEPAEEGSAEAAPRPEDQPAPAGFQETAVPGEAPATEPYKEDPTDWMTIQIQSQALPLDDGGEGPVDAGGPSQDEEPAADSRSHAVEEPGAEPVEGPGPARDVEPYREMETRAMDEEELEHARTSWRERAESNEPPGPEPDGEPGPYREMETQAMSEEELDEARKGRETPGETVPEPAAGPYREMETRDMTDVVERVAAGDSGQPVGPGSPVSGFEPYREMETRDMSGDIQALGAGPPTEEPPEEPAPAEAETPSPEPGPAQEPAPPAAAHETPPPEEEPPGEPDPGEPSRLTRLLAAEEGAPGDGPVEPEPEPPEEPEEELSPKTPLLGEGETSRLGTIVEMLASTDGDPDEDPPLPDRPRPEEPQQEEPPKAPPPRMDTDRLGTLVQMLTSEDTGAREKDASGDDDAAEEEDAGDGNGSSDDGEAEGEEEK